MLRGSASMSDGEDEDEFRVSDVEDDDDGDDEPEMDYDMWEGQFEFIGPSGTVIPQGLMRTQKPVQKVQNGLKKLLTSDKVQVLQQQMGVLQDSATHNDERYTRAKADNAALQARVIMLEEQLRDSEMRADERIHEEQRRSKELMARIEREKLLQLENSSIRLHAAEGESSNFKEEAARQRIRIEKLETERTELHDQLQDLRYDISEAKEQEHRLKEQERRLNKEHEAHNQLIEELSKEVERLRSEARTPALPTTSPEALRLDELHEEMASLREINSQLQEANEELQANLLHAGVEQGRKLTAGEFSLASELEEMTQDEIQQALKEQQEVNAQLRSYIDGILLNIVEKCPQLLERSS